MVEQMLPFFLVIIANSAKPTFCVAMVLATVWPMEIESSSK
jgi:hypothetical protein